MSLIKSKQPKIYRWHKGDLITATEAAALLGYKCAKIFQVKERLEVLLKDFESVNCVLTLNILINGSQRFLRSEINEFLSRKVENAQKKAAKTKAVAGQI
jgi:hypothetical protein